MIPTRHDLGAALAVMRLLDTTPTPGDGLRSAYQLLPSDGVFAAEDYRRGEALLIASGIVIESGTDLRLAADAPALRAAMGEDAEALLLAEILTRQEPIWLAAATRDEQIREELIPSTELAALKSTFQGAALRMNVLFETSRKHDEAARSRLGELGETCVEKACRSFLVNHGRPDLARDVVRVSAISDMYGYDIASPTLDGGTRHLEVKTVGASLDVIRIYLSRHEARIGSMDAAWRLVVCQGLTQEEVAVKGSCSYDAIADILPTDPKSGFGFWSEAKLLVPSERLHPGLSLTGEDL